MPYKVFLSHSAEDATWVKWIAANARQAGIEVYLYEHDPRPGQMLAEKLQAAIRDSDAVAVLLTARSQFSPYVQQEVGFAKALGKSVIPLVQPGTDMRALAMLEGVEYIPFDFDNPMPALHSLLPHLQTLKQTKENQRAVLLGFGTLVALALFSGRGK